MLTGFESRLSSIVNVGKTTAAAACMLTGFESICNVVRYTGMLTVFESR